MWKIILVLCLLLSITLCFNINIENTRFFQGSNGSQFGFRLKFHEPSNDDSDITLLVSAPQDASPSTNVEKGGSVHYCYNALSPDSDCSETKDQSMKNPVPGNQNGYVEEEFGYSLSVSKEIYLICAPRWKDTLHADENMYTFMLGRCSAGYFTQSRPREDIAPYFNYQKGGIGYISNNEYYQGMATFGFSSDITEESIVAIGTPGLTISEGAIYVKDVKGGEQSQTNPNKFVHTLGTTAYGYEGYDVKFGHLCNQAICFAAGAPNQYIIGRVFLYKWENKQELVKLQTLEGENNWSYFGSVLCTVNVDADSYDELLIGAPYYTDVSKYTGGSDLGRVYIYKRNEQTKEYALEFSLGGSLSSHSRFGSAIASVGSINLDEFKDVIIGAPGEEDNMGCVYIYLGSSLGLSREYSQRICASQLPTATTGPHKSFGSAFSGPVNLKDSGYPIFAVGSPLSDTVTLFKCRPIVNMTALLQANPDPITMPTADDNKEISTTVTLCLSFVILESKKVPLDFTVEFEIDTQITEETSKRATFVVNGDQKYRLTRNLTDSLTSPICLDYKAQIIKKRLLRNRFTPIEVVAKYNLDGSSGIGPVQNLNNKKQISLIFSFTNDCGADNVCKADLNLQGRLVPSNNGEWPYIVVNHTSELAAVIQIANSGETSFWTQILVHVDEPFTFIDFKSNHIKYCESLQTDVVSNEINVVCNYYQPLVKDASIELILMFDTGNVNLDKELVKVSVDVMPKYEKNNPEANPDDNSILLSLPVFIVAPVTIDGVSSPAEVALSNVKSISPLADADIDTSNIEWKSNSDGMKLNHKLQIQNQGPSFLPKTDIFLRVPIFLPDATQLLTSLSIELSINKGKAIVCFQSERVGSITTTPTTTQRSTSPSTETSSSSTTTAATTEKVSTTRKNPFTGGISRRKRAASEAEEQNSNTYSLNCQLDSKYCKTYRCQLPVNLPPRGHAEINITFTIADKNIAMPEDYSVFELTLDTSVAQPDHNLFKDWSSDEEQEANKETFTLFHYLKSGGKINLWIIIVSIVGGLFLIFIISIILWKCGFFKREKHYKVEKWKRESQRRSQAAASDTQPNGDDS